MRGRRWRSDGGGMCRCSRPSGSSSACGDDDDDAGAASDTTAAPASDLTVGLVSDVGKFNDRSFNQSALEGLEQAEAELGVKGTPIESRAASDYIPNLDHARPRRRRPDHRRRLPDGRRHRTRSPAQFPDQNFAIVDFPQAGLKDKPANVRGLTFATNENSYLIGYMAAKMVAEAGRQAGHQRGRRPGDPDRHDLHRRLRGGRQGRQPGHQGPEGLLAGVRRSRRKCKELALDQIAKGSQVVFQVAGGCGLGALSAAADKDVWGIGVDRDQSDLGPHILTSAVKRVDTSVFDTIKAVQDGTFKGGEDATFDLANDGVALGKISPEVPQEHPRRGRCA